NMGSNIIFPDVSIISFAASSVLQLGITMDYAIFLLHTYREERRNADPLAAAERALPRTAVNIIAGGLTTIGGFAALYFMRFTIGADLANVIIKGVALSIITVMFVQPCLLVFFDRPSKALSHKKPYVNVEPFVKGVMKGRYVIAVAAILLVAPAFIAQNNVSFSYLKIYEPPKETTSQQALADSLQNQIILAVPLDSPEGNQKEFMAELKQNEKISSVIGAFSVLDMSEEEIKSFLNIDAVASVPVVKTLFRKIDTQEGEKWYTLYLVEIDGDTEDEAAFAAHAHLKTTLDKYFDESYPLGVLTGVADMAQVTPGDFLRVTLISVAIILIIMSILLKSIRKSVLMVALIELAIWLNIGLNTVIGEKINFMIYIIISSVQLGCTVDYAILLSTRFEETKREFSDAKTAMIKASASAFPAISVSASIIVSVCLVIFFVSKNLLVKEMASLMARGAFISYLMVIIVLPCLLIFFKKIKPINAIKNRKENAGGNP
ncbi:MAG: MMPL family transporter, partial [Christensenellales bacterium]